MKPSAIACRIEYVWNGRLCPSAPTCPNVSSVFGFGVAVNAKNDRFFCLPPVTRAGEQRLVRRINRSVVCRLLGFRCRLQFGVDFPRTQDLLQLGDRISTR